MSPLLEMQNITKDFSGVLALDGIHITVNEHEVLAVCGENGSGKSTLMKVITGIYGYGQYQGEITFQGKSLQATSIKDTQAVGIAIIHQELTLIKELSVLENLFLGDEISYFGVVNFHLMYVKAKVLLERVKLDIDPMTPVKNLGMGQQQLVEIAKSLRHDAKLLILDEPTSSLTEKEIATLLIIVKELRQQGMSCIYISHKLNEVMDVSDRVCVIRDGHHIGTKDTKDLNEDTIIQMMVGRELTELYPKEAHDIGDVLLQVDNVTTYRTANSTLKHVDNVSFNVRAGEILGFSGLVGAGRTELMQHIFGCYPGKSEGHVALQGKALNISSSRTVLDAGIAMVPEDRKRHGIVPIMAVGSNITLASLDDYQQLGVLNNSTENQTIKESIAALNVKTASPNLSIKSLSGGNQQKAILAKFLLVKPTVLILDEPTRGIDVGAKYEIYKLIFRLAKEGIAIIVVSSELPEVLGICDRVIVMSDGRITADLPNENLTQQVIMDFAIGESA